MTKFANLTAYNSIRLLIRISIWLANNAWKCNGYRNHKFAPGNNVTISDSFIEKSTKNICVQCFNSEFLSNFWCIFFPVKFLVSVRYLLSSQNEDCINELSNQSRRKNCTNCRPSITSDDTTSQSVDPRPHVMKQNRHYLTLDGSLLNKFNADFSCTLRWPPDSIWSTGNFICSLQRSAAITIPEWCAV